MKWYVHLSLSMDASSLRGEITSINFSHLQFLPQTFVHSECSINCWTEFEIFEAQSPWGYSVKSTPILRKLNYGFSWNQLPGRETTWAVLWRDGCTGFGLIERSEGYNQTDLMNKGEKFYVEDNAETTLSKHRCFQCGVAGDEFG